MDAVKPLKTQEPVEGLQPGVRQMKREVNVDVREVRQDHRHLEDEEEVPAEQRIGECRLHGDGNQIKDRVTPFFLEVARRGQLLSVRE